MARKGSIVLTLYFTLIYFVDAKCSNQDSSAPRYYLIEKCHRSKLGVAAKANLSSLFSCKRLGIEKRALAFNYSPQSAVREAKEPVDYTCEVLKCAEADGGLSLVNDTRFDYYSIYAKPIPDINSTCIPATGVFHLVPKRLNYTEARDECRNMSGVLADVTSEQRTEALAQVLTGAGVAAAFVGLGRQNTRQFFVLNGDSLDCTTYRAWAPGHPKRQFIKYNCVVITRQKTWQAVPCKTRFPALCELVPGGPYKVGSLFASRKQSGNNNNIVISEVIILYFAFIRNFYNTYLFGDIY